MEPDKFDIVVVGGGIAGVSAVESACFLLANKENSRVLLLTASSTVKAVTQFRQLTQSLQQFDIEEKSSESLTATYQNLAVIHTYVIGIDTVKQTVQTCGGRSYSYKKLCLCTGGIPQLIAPGNPYVIGIRDTESAAAFQTKLKGAKRIVLVGNGGIATELAYEIRNVEVIWIVKHESISAAFIDSGAAQFFLEHLSELKNETAVETKDGLSKRIRYTIAGDSVTVAGTGSALGPDWHLGFHLQGAKHSVKRNLVIEYETTVKEVTIAQETQTCPEGWPVYVCLNNGKTYGCDLIVSATGVKPHIPKGMADTGMKLALDGGAAVDECMRTSVSDVYAAGDVCTASWEKSPLWFQMRLWTQARQMGFYAGKCMAADLNSEKILMDFCFELFNHVTKFFGFRVVLLGLFNGQGLQNQYVAYVRVTTGVEYIKLIVKEGKVKGAILIGDTELEETIENLILNETDISHLGENILNPDVDIEDYFD